MNLTENMSDNFRAGAKAMFDYLHCRAANNWHPRMQEQCDKENEIVLSWAKDALLEVSPEDASEWISFQEAYQNGFNAGKNSK